MKPILARCGSRCDLCLAYNPKLIDKSCPVRPCVIENGLANCSQCGQYVCDKLKERLVVYEDARSRVGAEIPEEDRASLILPYENKQRLDALRAPGKRGQGV